MNSFTQFLCLSLLIVGNMSLAMKFPYEGPILNKASKNGDLPQVQALLDARMPVDIKDNSGQTPLMLAGQEGHQNVCQLLIDRNAQVNATRNDDQWTALHLAALYKRPETCTLLLEHNASIDAKDKSGKTPLMLVANCSDYQMCQFLLDHHARIEAQDNEGRTPLGWAIYNLNVMQNAWPRYINPCQLLIGETIKELKKNAIILLGLRKFRRVSYMNSIQKEIIASIVQQVVTAREKALFKEIKAINYVGTRDDLYNLALRKINRTTNVKIQ